MLSEISFRGNEPTGQNDVKIIRRLAEIALSKLGKNNSGGVNTSTLTTVIKPLMN